MSTYTLSDTATLTSSSAYIGKSDTNVAAFARDLVLSNHNQAPATNVSNHPETNKIPFHGQAVASPLYAPPIMVHQPLGTLVPVSTNTPSLISKGHITHTAPFNVTKKLLFLKQAIAALYSLPAQLATDAGDFIERVMARSTTDTYVSGDLLAGDYVYNGNLAAGNGNVGAGKVFIFCYGSVNLFSVLAGVAGDNVVIISLGGTILFGAVEWRASAVRNVLMIAENGILCSSSSPTNTTDFAVTQNNTLIIGSVPISKKVWNGISGEPVANPVYTNVVAYNAGDYSDIHVFDGSDAGTRSYYNMVPSTIATNFLAVAFNIFARLCVQYQVHPAGAPLVVNGVYYLPTTFFGLLYATALSFQTFAGEVANFGASSEYNDFSDYFVPAPSKTWLKTYRVNDNTYAPIGGNRFFTLDVYGYIVVSPVDIVLPSVFPYFVKTTQIDSIPTVSLSTTIPSVVVANDGGMDPYTTITATHIESTYRDLQRVIPTPVDVLAVPLTLDVADGNYIDYAPLNGTITSAGNILGKIRITNPGRKATIVYREVVCKPSTVAGEVMQVHSNGASVVPVLDEYVMYKDAAIIRFTSGGDNYTLAAGSSVLVGLWNYTYTVVGAVGTFVKVSGAFTITVGSWTFGAVVASSSVFIKVIFGDTLSTTLVHLPIVSANPGNLPSLFFTRGVVYYNQQVASSEANMYLPGISQSTLNAFALYGIVPVPGMPDYYIDNYSHVYPLIFPEVVIYGTVSLPYAFGDTVVKVPILDGVYPHVVVSNGAVPLASFPFVFGITNFVAVVGAIGGNITSDLTTTVADFPALVVLYHLNNLRIISDPSGIIANEIIDGSNVRTVSGSGVVVFEAENGNSYAISVA